MPENEQTSEERRKRRAALLLLLALLALAGILLAMELQSGKVARDTGGTTVVQPATSSPTTTTPDDDSTGQPDAPGPGEEPTEPDTGPGFTVDQGTQNGGSTETDVSTTPDPAPTPDPGPNPDPDANPVAMPKITAGPDDPTKATRGTFFFTASGATSYLCSTDVAPTFVVCSNPQSYAGGTFPEGIHTFQVKAVSAGGTSKAATYTWRVDLTPPPAPTFEKTPDSPNTSDTATFEMTDAEKEVAYECSLDGVEYTSCKDVVQLEGLAPGMHTFCVKAIDTAGNSSAPSCATWQEGSGGGGSGGGGGGGSPGLPYTIGGAISTPLRPGGAAAHINVTFSSPNAGNGGSGVNGTQVSNLVVAITSVTGPNITLSRPCTAADFALTQFGGAYPFFVPFGASSLSSLGFGPGTWPRVQLINRPTNQDGCKGATIHFSYAGTS